MNRPNPPGAAAPPYISPHQLRVQRAAERRAPFAAPAGPTEPPDTDGKEAQP